MNPKPKKKILKGYNKDYGYTRKGKVRKMYVIDEDLDKQFKKACEDTNVTMSNTLEKFMLIYVQRVMSEKISD